MPPYKGARLHENSENAILKAENWFEIIVTENKNASRAKCERRDFLRAGGRGFTQAQRSSEPAPGWAAGARPRRRSLIR